MARYPDLPTNPGKPQPYGPSDVPIAPQVVPSRRSSKRRRKWFAAASGIIAALSLAGGTAGIIATRNEHRISSSAPTTPSTTSNSTSGATAMQQWWSSARDDFIDAKHASEEAQQAMDVIRPGALATACQHVHDAAEVRLRSHLPTPDAELTAELHAAIEDFHSAAHMCLAVVAGSPQNYDGEFLSSMAQANRHMSAAEDIINRTLISV
jgi:flagellar hook-basal body complex protein FliE